MSSTCAVLNASADDIQRAARCLQEGGLVAFPTETVYGLGADATSDTAVARVFAAKGRPQFDPLIVHVKNSEMAAVETMFTDRAARLAAAFWPGPLTLVLKRKPESRISHLVSGGLDTLAVRAPGHPIAQDLIDAAGCPIAAPSANPFGRISPTRARHVVETLGWNIDMVIDGGACSVGIESTVIDVTGATPTILRPGGISLEALEAITGPLATPSSTGTLRSPGMLQRHYSPVSSLRLNAQEARPGETLIGFGPGAPPDSVNLSLNGDVTEAAANLFAVLHAADRLDSDGIAVMPIPDAGLGRAINDRLRRAAARTDADDVPGDDWNDERGPQAPCILPDIEDHED